MTVPFSRFLGYDHGEDGNLVINQEQAKIVKQIYGLFLKGKAPRMIAKMLTEQGIPTLGGKEKWSDRTVRGILTNEKYKGGALLQKSFTVDFLTKAKKDNEGEIPKYYVKGNHEAIIEPEVVDLVQNKMALRTKGKNGLSSVSIFSSKIKCGDCGSWYGSKTWHSNSKYKRTIWQCNHKYHDGNKCATPHFIEEDIQEKFITAANQIIENKDEIIENFNIIKDTIFSTEKLESEKLELETEVNQVAGLIEECISENARVALDQTDYENRYTAFVERYDRATKRLEKVQEEIQLK